MCEENKLTANEKQVLIQLKSGISVLNQLKKDETSVVDYTISDIIETAKMIRSSI